MDYKEYQQRLFDTLLRAKGTPAEGAGYLLLVEHPAVYTLGKSGHAENLLVGEEYLRSIGAEFYHIDRGGDITFHGPGQIVGYPILDGSPLRHPGRTHRRRLGRLDRRSAAGA